MAYQNDVFQICGVWTNIPRVYFKSLKRGDVQIVLASRKQPDGIIGGSLLKPRLITRGGDHVVFFPTPESERTLDFRGA